MTGKGTGKLPGTIIFWAYLKGRFTRWPLDWRVELNLPGAAIDNGMMID
jgi:hypothetical protein